MSEPAVVAENPPIPNRRHTKERGGSSLRRAFEALRRRRVERTSTVQPPGVFPSPTATRSSRCEIVLDLEARILSWPDGFLGFHPHELVGQLFVRMLRIEDHTAFEMRFGSLRSSGAAYSCKLRCIRKTWETSHQRISVWPHLTKHGELRGARLIAEDVTELEKLREEVARLRDGREVELQRRYASLLDQLRELHSVLNHLPSSFLLVDRGHRVRQISTSLARELDAPSPGENWRCDEWLQATGRCLDDCPIEHVFQAAKEVSATRRIRAADGTTRYIEHRLIPIRNGGRVDLVLEQRTDVTARRSAEAQLLRSERLAAAGEIAAVVAHEARNSLTSIKLTLQLLQEDSNGDPDGSSQIGTALTAVQRIESLVHQLLAYAGPIPISPAVAETNAIVEEALQLVRSQLQRGRVELELRLAKDLPPIPLDREYLKQVLVNLLLNAAQAMEGGGRVVIRTRLAQLPTARPGDPRDHEGRHGVQISVEDSGPGVPPEILDKVFDPFFTTKAKGTGLGLPLVRRIAEAHGGIVRLCNAPWGGTIVNVWLPQGTEANGTLLGRR